MKNKIPGFISVVILSASTALSASEIKTAEVGYIFKNFYNPQETIHDGGIRVTATNAMTDEVFENDSQVGNFLLPLGTYIFTGNSEFCFVAPTTATVTEAMIVILPVGCE
ncbi:MAG: hypothetical protein M3Q07_27750 [Pseudobdellovibrionaceae bacterium]|nr:hypothetical protein [Pseudobdellovibrionaceae bacterium]